METTQKIDDLTSSEMAQKLTDIFNQDNQEDGANLMIGNGWLEQPPTAPDRKELVLGKKTLHSLSFR
jgi:hypothetical protein